MIDRPGGPPETITCVECGGTAHLLTRPPEGEPVDAFVAAYRCSDCLDRFDVVWEED